MLASPAAGTRRPGLAWFDAHGDFNTPETDAGGFLDGHGLAMCVGRCWTALTSAVPGFSPLPENRVILVGARSLDAAEEVALRGSAIDWLDPDRTRNDQALGAAVDAVATGTDSVHLHVDLDVHDPSIAPANEYAAADGLSAAQGRRGGRRSRGPGWGGSAAVCRWRRRPWPPTTRPSIPTAGWRVRLSTCCSWSPNSLLEPETG